MSAESLFALLTKLLTAAVVTLVGTIALLWREMKAARAEAETWQRKWADEVKERSTDSELFLKSLEKLHTKHSKPPGSE